MAKKKPRQRQAVTADRFRRLHSLVGQLGESPRTRAALLAALKIDVRGFYRDLELLRGAGVAIVLRDGRYTLGEAAEAAVGKLPFPDPLLSLGQARQLARGRTALHAALAKRIEELTG